MLRIAVVALMVGVSSLWITPIHELTHQAGALVVGFEPKAIDLWFEGPFLFGWAGWEYDSVPETWQRLMTTGGPWLLLYFPGAIALWKWRGKGMPSLLLSILVGQGGLYTAYGLILKSGDSWAMVQSGVSTIIFIVLSIALLVTAGFTIVRYIRGDGKRSLPSPEPFRVYRFIEMNLERFLRNIKLSKEKEKRK